MAVAVQVEQVLMVCPDIPREDIERDLIVTGDVQETINRIFEGNYLVGARSPGHKLEGVPASLSELASTTLPADTEERCEAAVHRDAGDQTLCKQNGRFHICPGLNDCANDFGGTHSDSGNDNRRFERVRVSCDSDEDSDCDELPYIWLHKKPVKKVEKQGSTSSYKEHSSSLASSSSRHCTDSTGGSADSGIQLSPTKDTLSYECHGSPVEVVPDVIEKEERPCVDLTLSPQKVNSDTPCTNSELFPSADLVSRESPISLSSNECDDVNTDSHSATEDQTSRTAPLQDANCSNYSSIFVQSTKSSCSTTGKQSDSNLPSPKEHIYQDFLEDAVFAAGGSRSQDPVGLHHQDNVSSDNEIMDGDNSVGRCSPMSISSSDDEEEDVALSLLHRIRCKQGKDDQSGLGTCASNELANQHQDASNDGATSDRYHHQSHKLTKDVADLSNDRRKRGVDVSKPRVPKSYHEISDEEEDASLKTNYSSCPSAGASFPEVRYGTLRWEDDSEPLESHHGSSLGALSQGSSCDSVPAKKKAKRRPEEIAASKQQALEKQARKEQEKQLKMRQQLEKKQHKEREAHVQRALKEAHKAHRPEECMKYVTVVIDPLLLEDSGGAVLLAKLQELDSKTAIESQPIPGSITWRRQVMEHNLGDDLQLNTLHQVKEECEAVIQLSVASFVDMVHTFKQEQQGTVCTGQESLREYAMNVQQILAGKAVTFIIQGMEKYFRLQKNSKQRNFRSAVLGNEPAGSTAKARRKKRPIEDITTMVTRVDMEEALVDLQLYVGCNVRFVETPTEVADSVAMFTKSVAETPFKRERDKATFSFHVDTEWAGGVKVNKEGRGLLRVWRQQLQQFRNVSPEIASSIIAVYPSPRRLLEVYARCDTVQEARKLLQDIVIRRGEGVLATIRRVGPELSKRVHTLMTSKDPSLAL